MARYASQTDVSPTSSQNELKALLRRMGADKIVTGEDAASGENMLHCRVNNRWLKFTVQVPPVSQFSATPTGRPRDADMAYREWEKEERRQWRVLVLLVKAKLVAIEEGTVSFDQEFMPYMLVQNGATFAEHFTPQLDALYLSNEQPRPLHHLLTG